MNAKISGIREGDRVEIECTAAAKTAEAYQTGVEMTARVWRRRQITTSQHESFGRIDR